jgi:hypothetical protein
MKTSLRPVRVTISDPTLFADLREHFQRAGFAVQETGEQAVDVRRADAPDSDQARREIELHLQVWRARHLGAEAELGPST